LSEKKKKKGERGEREKSGKKVQANDGPTLAFARVRPITKEKKKREGGEKEETDDAAGTPRAELPQANLYYRKKKRKGKRKEGKGAGKPRFVSGRHKVGNPTISRKKGEGKGRKKGRDSGIRADRTDPLLRQLHLRKKKGEKGREDRERVTNRLRYRSRHVPSKKEKKRGEERECADKLEEVAAVVSQFPCSEKKKKKRKEKRRGGSSSSISGYTKKEKKEEGRKEKEKASWSRRN